MPAITVIAARKAANAKIRKYAKSVKIPADLSGLADFPAMRRFSHFHRPTVTHVAQISPIFADVGEIVANFRRFRRFRPQSAKSAQSVGIPTDVADFPRDRRGRCEFPPTPPGIPADSADIAENRTGRGKRSPILADSTDLAENRRVRWEMVGVFENPTFFALPAENRRDRWGFPQTPSDFRRGRRNRRKSPPAPPIFGDVG